MFDFLKNKGKSDSNKRINQILGEIHLLLNSDEEQNIAMSKNPVIKELLFDGTSGVDRLPNAEGSFGRDMRNPIPCNGPLGEWTYLSRLLYKDTNEKMFFHRLCSVGNNIDQFELISMSGRVLDYLYLDMYHPRKSKFCPDGYVFQNDVKLLRGITRGICMTFPAGLPEMIRSKCIDVIGVALVDPDAKNIDVIQAKKTIRKL